MKLLGKAWVRYITVFVCFFVLLMTFSAVSTCGTVSAASTYGENVESNKNKLKKHNENATTYKESVITTESAFTGTRLIAEMNRISAREIGYTIDELARAVASDTKSPALNSKSAALSPETADLNPERADKGREHRTKTVLRININSEFISDEIEVRIPAFVFNMASEKEIDEIKLASDMILLSLTSDAVNAAGYPDARFEIRKLSDFRTLYREGFHESKEVRSDPEDVCEDIHKNIYENIHKDIHDDITAAYDIGLYLGNKREESFSRPVLYFIPCQWMDQGEVNDVRVLYLNNDGSYEEVECKYHTEIKAVSFKDSRTGIFVIKAG